MNKKLTGLASLSVLLGVLASCTAENGYINDPENEQGGSTTDVNVVNLVKAPEIKAYSGNESVSLVNLNPTITKWQWDTQITGWPENTDRGDQVSDSEYRYVIEYLRNHPDEGYTEVDLSTYFLQNVGTSNANYNLEYKNPDGTVVRTDYGQGGGRNMDSFKINGVHVNDYNASWGPKVYVENLPLTNPTYHDSYAGATIEGKYRFYYIPNSDGNGYSLYLCFDYSTSKYDNGQLDFKGDGIYNDWVIKVIPGDGSEVTPPTTDTNPNPEPDPDPSEGDEPSAGDPTDQPVVDHVETNLSIEKHNDYLSTHLSVHVRANTNIEVFIPIKDEYYCAADDLEIVQRHEEEYLVHGGPEILEYNINGNTVTLNIAYEPEGIRVTSSGINEDVLEYLQGVTGDGVTFEIWTYMNIEDVELTDNEWINILKESHNASTIEFLDRLPSLYVNAFNHDSEGMKWNWDCTVNIKDSQKVGYQESVTDYFFNGSPYNELYYRN